MKNKSFIRIAAIGMAAVMTLTPVSASAAALIKFGSRGTEVKTVQTTLKDLGYFTYPKATGYYGKITQTAVKRFQKDNGITPDGVIGKITRNALLELKKNNTASKVTLTSTVESTVENDATIISGDLDWFKEVRDIWKRGMNATITDVDTGISFQVKRTYGTNHADIEPLTKEDTKIIKEIWGGFSWERRAVVVEFGNYILAGSMSAMPHAGVDSKAAEKYVSGRSGGYGYGCNLDKVKNNGANGVMDLHFKNSRTHSTNTKQKSMQDMVKKAAEYIKNMN